MLFKRILDSHILNARETQWLTLKETAVQLHEDVLTSNRVSFMLTDSSAVPQLCDWCNTFVPLHDASVLRH